MKAAFTHTAERLVKMYCQGHQANLVTIDFMAVHLNLNEDQPT